MSNMTDIQQWRRKIQPARSRTPAPMNEFDEPETLTSATTPRKGLKPKFPSYFTQQPSTADASAAEPSKTDLSFHDDLLNPPWPSPSDSSALLPKPNAEGLIDAIMCRLLSRPYDNLDSRFNGMLLQIFESWRNVMDEKQQLAKKVDRETYKRCAIERALHQSATEWEEEKQAYKAEVKRLELILAKGKRGLAEVTLARQKSVLRVPKERKKRSDVSGDGTMETIFEFLEKSQIYDDRVWNGQRATMRKRPSSPSAEMRRLSKTMMENFSDMDGNMAMLPGTFTGQKPSTLAEASMLEAKAAERSEDDQPDPVCGGTPRVQRANAAVPTEPNSVSESGDTLSTFSCAGDLLPEEAADVNLIEAAGTDNDLVAIKRIANVLAKRRNVDADKVMPTLLELFAAHSLDKASGVGMPKFRHGPVPRAQTVSAEQMFHSTVLRKQPSMRMKASGFFHKLKPQLTVDLPPETDRRFSFEHGDDEDAAFSAPPQESMPTSLPAAVKDRLLRKSVSMSSFSEPPKTKTLAASSRLSPLEQSPTASAQTSESVAPMSESRRSSRIPTPVFSNASLARPRQDREDSASSLLTAIKHSENMSQRSSSPSKSIYSSPSASRVDLTADFHRASAQRYPSSNSLLAHTNALRGNAFANAAAAAGARDSGASPMSGDPGTSTAQSKRPTNARTLSLFYSHPAEQRDVRKENTQPTNPKSAGSSPTEDLDNFYDEDAELAMWY